jgi:hypothetical protein
MHSIIQVAHHKDKCINHKILLNSITIRKYIKHDRLHRRVIIHSYISEQFFGFPNNPLSIIIFHTSVHGVFLSSKDLYNKINEKRGMKIEQQHSNNYQ